MIVNICLSSLAEPIEAVLLDDFSHTLQLAEAAQSGTFVQARTKLITLAKPTNQDAAEFMGWAAEQVAGIRRTYVDQGAVNMAIAAHLRDSL